MLAGSRAGGVHSRTIEVLDQRGVVDRFLAEGQAVQAAMFGTTVLDMSDFPTRHPYSLGIWQNKIERIMAEWLAELGGADLIPTCGVGLRTGPHRRRRRAFRRDPLERSSSSGVTVAAASSVRQAASSSQGWIRPGAT